MKLFCKFLTQNCRKSSCINVCRKCLRRYLCVERQAEQREGADEEAAARDPGREQRRDRRAARERARRARPVAPDAPGHLAGDSDRKPKRIGNAFEEKKAFEKLQCLPFSKRIFRQNNDTIPGGSGFLTIKVTRRIRDL